MISMARIRRCVYPFPVYEAHFSDNTYSRMSVWSPLGKPWAFDRFRHVLSKSGRREIVDGYLEHDVAGKPWLRLQDPLFSGEVVATKAKKTSSAAIRKWAETILEQIDSAPDPTMAVLTAAAVNDLRAALGQAA